MAPVRWARACPSACSIPAYNTSDEVIGAVLHGIHVPGGPVTEAFAYDPMGNRLTSARTGPLGLWERTYQANALNQYTSVNWGVPPFEPGHDADGNQVLALSAELGPDAVWNPAARLTLAWDGQQRLVAVDPAGGAVPGSRRVRYDHDAQGRRVRRTVEVQAGAGWAFEERTWFVYDGWNVVEECTETVSGVQVLRLTWGLDLSGTPQGAGGVGGLVRQERFSVGAGGERVLTADLWSHADGNGNVIALTDGTGAPVASYRYSTLGDVLSATGAAAALNRFRFSTKPVEPVSGFLDYGYRFLDPTSGRWLSRDPIEEHGGLNLYGMVGNDPVGRWDLWGLDTSQRHGKRFRARGVDYVIHSEVPRHGEGNVHIQVNGRTGDQFKWKLGADGVFRNVATGQPLSRRVAREMAENRNFRNWLGNAANRLVGAGVKVPGIVAMGGVTVALANGEIVDVSPLTTGDEALQVAIQQDMENGVGGPLPQGGASGHEPAQLAMGQLVGSASGNGRTICTYELPDGRRFNVRHECEIICRDL